MKYVFAVFLWIVTLSPATWAQSKEQAAPDFHPGLWEVTTQMIGPISGEPSTSEVCMADPGKIRAPKNKAEDDCQAVETAAASNEVAYTVQCPKLKRSTTTKFQYYGDRYEGTSTTTMDGIEFKVKYTAKRIGSCAASSQNAGGAR